MLCKLTAALEHYWSPRTPHPPVNTFHRTVLCVQCVYLLHTERTTGGCTYRGTALSALSLQCGTFKWTL